MIKRPQTLLGRLLAWRTRHIPHKHFILILSILVGLISGLVAVILKNSTHFIQELVRSDFFDRYFNLYYFVFPIIGIVITVLIKRMFKAKVGEGISSTLFAISRRNGFLAPYKMYASVITSIFTVGFGGSLGLESPAVSSGSAIGSNLGRLAHVNFKSRILLISCATTGAIASIFNAPIAAIIFTIEIFSLDLTFSSLIPLLLASVSGAVTSIFIQGNDYLFHYKSIASFQIGEIPIYLILGILAAFTSVYFNKVYFYADSFFTKIKSPLTKVLLGGTLLGTLIFLIPPLYGEGYETINYLLNDELEAVVKNSIIYEYISSDFAIIGLLFGLIIFKVFASVFSIGAGGVGGVFAPSLFTGASLGFVFAYCLNQFGIFDLASSNYALAGMAGLMAGVLHAPFTAIFMIAEITGSYELFIPLMLVSATSFLVTSSVLPHSIYTMQLAQRGDLLTHNKDQVVLTLLKIDKVIETDFEPINQEMTLGDLVKVVSHSKRNLFPVLDEYGNLVGILTLDDFRSIMFDQSLYENTMIKEFMSPPPATVQKNDSMADVATKFELTGAWNLPVLVGKQYMGFISKSKLFSAYRKKLIEFSE